VLTKGKITLKFDREIQEHYIIWRPVFVGAGETKHETLEDLRAAAHFGVDTLINIELQNIGTKKED